MYISGIKPTLDVIHKLGATSYCTQGDEVNVGLASAIGGCGVKQVDLVNAYASLARQGVYKPQSTILQVTNSSGEVLKKWTDTAGVQIVDPQSAYIVSNILTDDNARAPLDGHHALGMDIPGVQTATKTGTSDKNGYAKDIWMASYSPALTMAVWLGNSDASILKNGTSSLPGAIIAKVMEYAHKDIYQPEGLWKPGDWYTIPTGIQSIGGQVYPSWWNSTQGQTTTKMTFDKVSKKKATSLTPPGAQIQLDVTKMVDPITKKDVYIAPDGYNANASDDVHKSSDAMPIVTISVDPTTKNSYIITATVKAGTFTVTGVQIAVGDTVVTTLSGSGTYNYTANPTDSIKTITATVTDSAYYTGTGTGTIPAYQ
jgi:membrane peptidoglycan carboxypeptidase